MTYVAAWTKMDYSDDIKKTAMAPDKLEWFTVGIRPQWKWSELTSTVLDLGFDRVKNGADFTIPTSATTYKKRFCRLPALQSHPGATVPPTFPEPW